MSLEKPTSQQPDENAPKQGFSGPELLQIIADFHKELQSQPGGLEKFKKDLEAFQNQLAQDEASDVDAQRKREQEWISK